MALKQNQIISVPGSIEVSVNNAYIKVTNLIGDKTELTGTIGFFKTKELADQNDYFKTSTFKFSPLTNERWDKQSYAYLKTLPEFAGAVDC